MTTVFNNTNYSKNVQTLRDEMIKSGLKNGLNHPNTIRLSQKLDELLDVYLK